MTADLVIRGGLLVDGTGAPARRTDVLLNNGRIEAVGLNLQTPPGTTTVNAEGKTLLPGLFDLHTHVNYPTVGGSTAKACGSTSNPAPWRAPARVMAVMSASTTFGWNCLPAFFCSSSKATSCGRALR